MTKKVAFTDKNDLLKILASSILLGGGANAAFRALAPGKKPFDAKRDIPGEGAGAIPVYVDMTPDEAARYQELTGLGPVAGKTASETDYNWLTKALVGGGGMYAGWTILDKVLDKLRKRKLDTQLEEAQTELGSLYSAKPLSGIGAMPTHKKLGSLQKYMDSSFQVWKTAHDGNLKPMLKDAGLIDNVGEAAAAPILAPVKSLAGYSLKSVAPVLAAIALLAGYSAYKKQAPVAGARPDLAAIRKETRDSTPRPYVELMPRIREPKPLDPDATK